jgi:hypothetical protein
MARVLCMVDDLMLQSKVTETLRSAGHEVVAAPCGGAGVDVIVADLDAVAVESVAAMAPPKLGFCRHTDVAAREAAEKAGFERVVPRSRMARELPELVAGLLDR